MSLSVEAAFGYLQNAAGAGRLAHAYLITGSRGSGKTELAAKLIAMVNGGPVAANVAITFSTSESSIGWLHSCDV